MMYAEPNWGMDNIKRHKECPFRTKLANCDAVGGFCTSVNETICEGIHKALELGKADRPTGHWIDTEAQDYIEVKHRICSVCRREPSAWCNHKKFNYCPNCGAQMESEE